jgi:hypothetical protein
VRAGLRVAEVASLKVSDADSARMLKRAMLDRAGTALLRARLLLIGEIR